MKNPRPRTVKVYLSDRYTGMASYITEEYGLEVPISFEMPSVQELPDSNDGFPVHHRMKYYSEGGTAWPRRTMLWHES